MLSFIASCTMMLSASSGATCTSTPIFLNFFLQELYKSAVLLLFELLRNMACFNIIGVFPLILMWGTLFVYRLLLSASFRWLLHFYRSVQWRIYNITERRRWRFVQRSTQLYGEDTNRPQHSNNFCVNLGGCSVQISCKAVQKVLTMMPRMPLCLLLKCTFYDSFRVQNTNTVLKTFFLSILPFADGTYQLIFPFSGKYG